MRVKSWAPAMWQSLFYIACGFYEGDWKGEDFRKQTLSFYTVFLTSYLPCSLCRGSTWKYIEWLNLKSYVYSDQKYALLLFLYKLKTLVDAKLIVQDEKEFSKIQADLPTFSEIAHRYLSQSHAYRKEEVDANIRLLTNSLPRQ